MKHLITLFAWLVVFAGLAIDLDVAQPKTLIWEDGNDRPEGTYKVYMSKGDTNNWFPLVVTTNRTVTIILKPDVYFFKVTALGFWGETEPSNIAFTPAPATNDLPPAKLIIDPNNRSILTNAPAK